MIKAHELRCEDVRCPLGIDAVTPRLSWRIESDTGTLRGLVQVAYRVLVASAPDRLARGVGDLWDSGRVVSSRSVDVRYAGRPLASRQRCWWQVRVWTRQAGTRRITAGAWSEPTWWEMGLLQPADWQARWIGHPDGRKEQETGRAPLFRKEFNIAQAVRHARAYICGLGYGELYLNGAKVGADVLAPVVSHYDRRAYYVTYDVTAYLRYGVNAVGVMLGNGWYNQIPEDVWWTHHAPWRDAPKLLLQMEIVLADGARHMIVSNSSWKTAFGPIVFNALRNGEYYDAREEKPGWDRPGYDDRDWVAAVVRPAPGGALSAQLLPIRVTDTLTPRWLREIRPGVHVFSMGQNMAGWARIRVCGRRGTTVTLKYAEKLDEAGDIDQENIKSLVKTGEFQTDKYTLKGGGVEVWEPRFTYHGFQYIKVTGFPGRPTAGSVQGRVVRSAFESVGRFACGHELLNRLQELTRWAYISNFVGIPTDCPHREKNGWTGDAQLAAETGLFNFAAAPAYRQWLQSFADAQRATGQVPCIVPCASWGFNWGTGPAWDSALINIPWYVYVYTGDRQILEWLYPAMQRYVAYMTSMATDHIVNFGLGDWCAPSTGRYGVGQRTPEAVTDTGYYFADCRLLARIARLLGRQAEASRYLRLATEIARAWRRAFYDPRTGLVAGNEMTGVGCALYQGLLPPAEQDRAVRALVRLARAGGYHARFGILGAKYVLNALAAHGHADVAFRILTQTSYPSWGHWVAQGATTLWETWEGEHSRNHIMFGDISAWMFKHLAGLQPDPEEPGFAHVVIRPNLVRGLDWAEGEHLGPYGLVRSAWRRTARGLRWEVRIPANCRATLDLPAREVREGGVPAARVPGVRRVVQARGRCRLEIGAGEYRFECR